MDPLTFLVLLRLMIRELKPKPVMVRFNVPTFRNRKDGTMANPQIPLDQIATVPLIFTDATGNQVDPVAGGSVTLDQGLVNVTIATDGSSVSFDPAAQQAGTFTATYTNGLLVAVQAFDVVGVQPGPSPATGVAFDTANITFQPRPAPGPTPTPPAPGVPPHLAGGPVRR